MSANRAAAEAVARSVMALFPPGDLAGALYLPAPQALDDVMVAMPRLYYPSGDPDWTTRRLISVPYDQCWHIGDPLFVCLESEYMGA